MSSCQGRYSYFAYKLKLSCVRFLFGFEMIQKLNSHKMNDITTKKSILNIIIPLVIAPLNKFFL